LSDRLGGRDFHQLLTNHHGPIITVGQPSTITPPCIVGSPIRAAIKFPIKTVGEPIAMLSGGPTHTNMSVARAAGWPAIRTVGQTGGRIGPPTCGTGGTPGVTIGHVCISPIRAAGGIVRLLQTFLLFMKYLLAWRLPESAEPAVPLTCGFQVAYEGNSLGRHPTLEHVRMHVDEPLAPDSLFVMVSEGPVFDCHLHFLRQCPLHQAC
jgi:hypothetical protein